MSAGRRRMDSEFPAAIGESATRCADVAMVATVIGRVPMAPRRVAGDLASNLLCGIAGLLDSGGLLIQLSGLLNQLLGALAGL